MSKFSITILLSLKGRVLPCGCTNLLPRIHCDYQTPIIQYCLTRPVVGSTAITWLRNTPDSKVHGAIVGPIWGQQDPGGPHVGPINFAIWDTSLTGALQAGIFTTFHNYIEIDLMSKRRTVCNPILSSSKCGVYFDFSSWQAGSSCLWFQRIVFHGILPVLDIFAIVIWMEVM